MNVKETVINLERMLPKLQAYEQSFNIDQEEEALKETKSFYDQAYLVYQELYQKEKKKHPELLDLFLHYERFKIHKYDQSARTVGNSTWTLNTTWTLVVDTPVGTFGVYTLGRSILAEFKEVI